MKVLIVDDSVVFRMAIKQALEETSGVEVAGALSNGQLAVDYLKKEREVDLITLDMEMPILDGLATIREIRKFNPKIPIIVFSSLTTRGAEKTIEALSSGANDFVTKEEAGGASSIDKSLEMIRQSLLPKVEAFKRRHSGPIASPTVVNASMKKDVDDFQFLKKPRLIVIASSTGGPEALREVFSKIEAGPNNVPILLVQHMPPVFTQKLAEMLSSVCAGYEVSEGKTGMRPESGKCYIAPGDYHMLLNSSLTIELNQGEKVCYVRPAANCLFDSVAENYNQQVAAFVLTGMGDDGAEGIKNLDQHGSYNFYQEESSCIVFGMPGSVKKTGLAMEASLDKIASLINEINSRV